MADGPCRVGVIGTGIVGSGVVSILQDRRDLIEQRAGVDLALAKVAELDRDRAIAAGVPEEMWVADYREIIRAPDISVVVELVGGTGIADTIVREALTAGKSVVTANKALLAEKGHALFSLARDKGVSLAFEAAVAGGIPIILALREGLIANRITSLLGIVNGTCNYILSEMIGKGVPYERCLREAQQLGYAEADPTFDVEGIDSGHKLALLSALALDTWVDFQKLPIQGMTEVDLMDVEFAQNLGYTVKLLAVARVDEENGRLFLSVHPAFLPIDHPLASVHGSLNAIALMGDRVQESMFYGRGAGQMPTASAVVADIAQVARSLRGAPPPAWVPSESPAYELAPLADYQTRYYLRFMVEDVPGVFGQMATVLGDHEVSIASVVQYENPDEAEGDTVPVVMLTHRAREGNIAAALSKISDKPFTSAPPVYLRIEE